MDYSTYEGLVSELCCCAVPILTIIVAVAVNFGMPSRRAWITYSVGVLVVVMIMNSSSEIWVRYAPSRVPGDTDLSAGVGIGLAVKLGMLLTAGVGTSATIIGLLRLPDRRRSP